MTTATSSLRKTARVRLAPADAFRLFTADMGAWWPLETHSVGRDQAVSVECEPRVGGHISETLRNGDHSVWGTIVVWEPASRVRFTWHPGSPESEATDVDVRFHADGDGTLVELVHTGWDRRPDGDTARANYESGWELVLGRYASAGDGS